MDKLRLHFYKKALQVDEKEEKQKLETKQQKPDL